MEVKKTADKPATDWTPTLPAASVLVVVGDGALVPVEEGPALFGGTEDEVEPMALARKALKVLVPFVAALIANTIPLEQWPA